MHLLERPLQRAARSRLAAAAAWPHGVDAYGALLDPAWSATHVRATVVGIRRQTADTATLALRPNANWPGHRAGQHVVLTVEVDGVRQSRCFSVASSARDARRLELTVKAGPASVVARHLRERVEAGDVVELSPPAGDFVLPDDRPPALALLSAGSGITPVLSMLRTLADDGHDGPVAFVHHARSGADVLYGPEVDELVAGRPGWRRLVVTEHDTTGDRTGRFEPAHLDAAGIDPRTTVAFACGPAPYLAAAGASWSAAGGPVGTFRTESYGAPGAGATTRRGAATGTLRFRSDGNAIEVADDGRPLLVQAEAAGLAPAHGCRRGICRTCVRPLVAGSVVEEGGVAVTAGPGSTVRLCVSVADGDVEVAL